MWSATGVGVPPLREVLCALAWAWTAVGPGLAVAAERPLAPATAGWNADVALSVAHPGAIAVDAQGGVWTVDPVRAEVTGWSGLGARLGPWGRLGSDLDGEFRSPSGLAAVGGFQLLVADRGNGRLVRYQTPLGGRGLVFAGVMANEGPAEFRPGAISADAAGRVAVLDHEQGQVRLLDAFGREEARVGGFGAGPARLRHPSAVALHQRRGVFVVDGAGVVVFDRFGNFRERRTLVESGTSIGGLAIDRAGRLWWTEPRGGRVRGADPEWKDEPGIDGLLRPSALAVHPDGGTLWVVQDSLRTLTRFRRER